MWGGVDRDFCRCSSIYLSQTPHVCYIYLHFDKNLRYMLQVTMLVNIPDIEHMGIGERT